MHQHIPANSIDRKNGRKAGEGQEPNPKGRKLAVQRRRDRRDNCNIPYWVHGAAFLLFVGKGVRIKRLRHADHFLAALDA
jgi:hypothetical protein